MAINYLTISYPTFVLGAIIDPEQANQNNADIVAKVGEIIDVSNGHASSISAIDAKLVNMDDNGAYSGVLTANMINVVEGIVMHPSSTIYWGSIEGNEEVAYRTDLVWDNVGGKPTDLLTQGELLSELVSYYTSTEADAKMSDALLNTINTGNFATIITKDFIASMNLVVGEEILMGANATIDWANIVGAPVGDWTAVAPTTIEDIIGLAGMLTHIDANGIYTGTLTAQQINAVLIDGVRITAVDELAIRGHANTMLGVNPKLAWQCADSLGESYIKSVPVGAGDASNENDTLLWGINSKDIDGTSEAKRGGVYVSGVGGTWADFITHGTMQVGSGEGFLLAPWAVDLTGRMNWHTAGGDCNLNPGTDGAMRIGSGENYIRINQPVEGGSICDFVTMVNGVSTTVASFGVSSGQTNNMPTVATTQFAPDGLSFTQAEAGATVTWTLVKDGDGKVTSMTSSVGDNFTIGY